MDVEPPRMMSVKCPGCEQALKVPTTAVGRHARCPVCKTKFEIPDPHQAMEETISGWLEEDLEELVGDEANGEAADGAAAGPPAERGDSPRDQQAEQDDQDQDKPPAQPRPLRPRRTTSQLSSGDTVMAQTFVPPKESPEPSPEDSGAFPSFTEEDLEPLNAPQGGPRPAPPVAGDRTYPTSLHITEPIPHLVVSQVMQQGVTFSFDSIWLEHDGFRLSIPFQCASCGAKEANDLTARPLVFIDRSHDQTRTPQDIEHGRLHSMRLLRPEQLPTTMQRLQGMARPFDGCMPYYTCGKHMGSALRCRTQSRSDGGITCEVIVPHGETALAWLLRVNGACGREFRLLEGDLASVSSETWLALSETCRQRLAVWCSFDPGERFKHYLSDADLSRHDAGLAGVVITDLRLIYHKYRHHGQVRLDEDATLLVQRSDRLAALYLETEGKRHRVAKIQAKEVPMLIDGLSDAQGLKVMLLKARG